jgi:hypothetical protein
MVSALIILGNIYTRTHAGCEPVHCGAGADRRASQGWRPGGAQRLRGQLCGLRLSNFAAVQSRRMPLTQVQCSFVTSICVLAKKIPRLIVQPRQEGRLCTRGNFTVPLLASLLNGITPAAGTHLGRMRMRNISSGCLTRQIEQTSRRCTALSPLEGCGSITRYGARFSVRVWVHLMCF